jgi:hypothetical protein
MSFEAFHGGQCLMAGGIADCELPMGSTRPAGSSACQQEQMERELWLSRPNAFSNDFGARRGPKGRSGLLIPTKNLQCLKCSTFSPEHGGQASLYD